MKKMLTIFGAIILFVFILFSTLNSKATLDKKNDNVKKAFFALQDPLKIRFEAIENSLNIAERIGGERDVITQTRKFIKDWKKDISKKSSPSTLVTLANRIEGNYQRLIRASELSPKLKNQADLTASFENVAAQSPRAYLISDYQKAVNDFMSTKSKFWRKLAFNIFSYDQPVQYLQNINIV